MAYLDVAQAAQPGSSRKDIFVLDQNHAVVHIAPRSPIIPPQPDPNQLGGWIAAGTLSAEWSSDGTELEVFGVGLDGGLWFNRFTVAIGAWSGWDSYGWGV